VRALILAWLLKEARLPMRNAKQTPFKPSFIEIRGRGEYRAGNHRPKPSPWRWRQI